MRKKNESTASTLSQKRYNQKMTLRKSIQRPEELLKIWKMKGMRRMIKKRKNSTRNFDFTHVQRGCRTVNNGVKYGERTLKNLSTPKDKRVLFFDKCKIFKN